MTIPDGQPSLHTDDLDTSLRARAQRTAHPRKTGPRTPAKRAAVQQAFLDSFRQMGNVTISCRVAGVARASIYQWLETDVPFSVRYHQAEEEAADVIEAEAWRRALRGTEKVVVSMGKVVYVDGKPLTERDYSDTILLAILRARNKHYRQQPPEVLGAGAGILRIIIETDTPPALSAGSDAYGRDAER